MVKFIIKNDLHDIRGIWPASPTPAADMDLVVQVLSSMMEASEYNRAGRAHAGCNPCRPVRLWSSLSFAGGAVQVFASGLSLCLLQTEGLLENISFYSYPWRS